MSGTVDYPNLHVWDERQSGSITIGDSRLPVWAIISSAIHEGWESVEAGWSPTEHYGFTEDDLVEFLHNLLDQRRSFARLLCVLADVERIERVRNESDWAFRWQNDGELYWRVHRALRACLDELVAS